MAQTKPILDRKAAETINLNVLKRLDPSVEEVWYFQFMKCDINPAWVIAAPHLDMWPFEERIVHFSFGLHVF